VREIYADKVLVITSNEIVEELARLFGVGVIKLKDYGITIKSMQFTWD